MGRRGEGGGGATARTHSHTHALPLHPRPLPARGAARRRGTVQPVGDARQLQGRPQPPPPRPPWGPRHPGPDGACTPPVPRPPAWPGSGCRPPPPPPSERAGLPAPPPPGKERWRQLGADLVSLGRAWERSRVSLVCLLAASFPPPPSSATPEPLWSLLGPSAATAVSAPAGDSGLSGGWRGRGAARSSAAGVVRVAAPEPSCTKCVT
ncbi:formin-like protein 20 [Mustela erminea]|uniref:formin-like protein 20 n=1 Tax=Mustela erminea TaxID=36723 RepID=UPI0013873C0D|nr:formin-like protein 20 [Mustela erminea]